MSCTLCGCALVDGRWVAADVMGADGKPLRREICDSCALVVHRAAEGAMYRLDPWEFVYSCGNAYGGGLYGDVKPGDIHWFAHRVVNTTKTALWVTGASIPAEHAGTEKEDRSKFEGWRYYFKGESYHFSRRIFEQQGWIWHRPFERSAFYKAPDVERIKSANEIEEDERRAEYEKREAEYAEYRRRSRSDVGLERDAHVLGLSCPFTEAELKDAYRRRAKEAHPDAGGPSWAFRLVNEAYERLLPEVES